MSGGHEITTEPAPGRLRIVIGGEDIKELVCFFAERVDELTLDGEPVSH